MFFGVENIEGYKSELEYSLPVRWIDLRDPKFERKGVLHDSIKAPNLCVQEIVESYGIGRLDS